MGLLGIIVLSSITVSSTLNAQDTRAAVDRLTNILVSDDLTFLDYFCPWLFRGTRNNVQEVAKGLGRKYDML